MKPFSASPRLSLPVSADDNPLLSSHLKKVKEDRVRLVLPGVALLPSSGLLLLNLHLVGEAGLTGER